MTALDTRPGRRHIIIAPQIYVALDNQPETDPRPEDLQPRRTEIPMVWLQDGADFRLDVELPEFSVLDVTFPPAVSHVYINGETIWADHRALAVHIAGAHAEATPAGLRLTCTARGAIHLLARCLLELDGQR